MARSMTVPERSWVWRLEISEARELLDVLSYDHSGENSVVNLRVLLAKLVPEKIKETRYQDILRDWESKIT